MEVSTFEGGPDRAHGDLAYIQQGQQNLKSLPKGALLMANGQADGEDPGGSFSRGKLHGNGSHPCCSRESPLLLGCGSNLLQINCSKATVKPWQNTLHSTQPLCLCGAVGFGCRQRDRFAGSGRAG